MPGYRLRATVLTLSLLAACVQSTSRARSQTTFDPPPETDAEPLHFSVADARASYSAAVRQLVAAGFKITFSDADAGALTAERDEIDAETTAAFRQRQRELWDDLTADQQRLAQRNGIAADFTRTITVRRVMTVSLVVSRNTGLVTPTVKTCSDDQGPVRCGQPRGLRREEAATGS